MVVNIHAEPWAPRPIVPRNIGNRAFNSKIKKKISKKKKISVDTATRRYAKVVAFNMEEYGKYKVTIKRLKNGLYRVTGKI